MIKRAMIIAVAAIGLPAAALAQQPIELTSEIFVERIEVTPDGAQHMELVPADRVIPGDQLRFVIRYNNPSDEVASNFVITNPIPASIRYLSAEGDGAVKVSVDGKTYGLLAELTVTATDGSERPAQAADVTHVQWAFNEIQPQTAGAVHYRGELK